MKNTYYEDELRYLRDVGPEFARANPEIARFLADRGSDPDVERILEGTAFLCGRIRQKLDDELPELTASMMSLLWPHYLRPVPSMTILELQPDIEAMRSPIVVPTGSEFASVPIDGTRCRYQSRWPVTVRPWQLSDIRLETDAAKPVRLVMTLQAAQKVELADLDLGTVRFHLAGDTATALTLYRLLASHVDHATVSDGAQKPNGPTHTLEASSISAAGLDREEAVLPFPPHAFPGYGLIQEYFSFRERFLFVDVHGLDRAVTKLGLGGRLELAITLNRRLETFPLVAPENVRLHCVPIVNLFKQAADPIRLKHDRVQYLVQPTKSGLADLRHAEVYSIDEVQGVTRSDAFHLRAYQPFYSFAHGTRGADAPTAYYQIHRVLSVLGGDWRQGTDTYVSFTAPAETGKLPENETISLDVTCTNRHLPGELRAGDIKEPTDTSPPGVAFRNIIKPTVTIPPPLGKELHWRLISHLSLNYTSLLDATRLKELLWVYDFLQHNSVQEAQARQRMLDGIKSVSSRYKERIVRGAPIRGVQVRVELDDDHFAGEGDAFLFAVVLDRFLGLYVTLNAFSQLDVEFLRTGQRHAFPPRWGDQATPVEARGGGGDAV